MTDRPILVVDDDGPFRARMARALRARGHAAAEAGGFAEALAALEALRPRRVLVDLRLPDGSGLDLVDAALAREPAARVVVLTGYGSIATAVEAVRRGAVQYFMKPVEVDAILGAFEGGAPPAPAEPETPSLDRVEWEHIQRVLQDCGGNVSEASRRLGLHRRSLQRKLDRVPPKR